MDQPEEVIFNEVGAETVTPEDDDYEGRVLTIIDDARDYERDILRGRREQWEEFYKGLQPYLGEEDTEDDDVGRSTVVSMVARDTIMGMMPSLMRIFTAQDSVCQFEPTNAAVVEQAAEQTKYIENLFWDQNEGFMIIYNVLMDALRKGQAAVKWWTDVDVNVKYETYHGVTETQYNYIVNRPNVEVVEQINYAPEEQGFEPTFDIAIKITRREACTKVASIPPEEFRISKWAKSVQDARLVGHERYVVVSDLVKKGLGDREALLEMGSGGNRVDLGMESIFRNQGQSDGVYDSKFGDEVLFGEWFIEIDADGDGVDELRYICTIGDTIVLDEPASDKKLALFSPDPEPHTAIGHSTTEQVTDLQVIMTNILRSTLDGMAEAINPTVEVVENMVNMEDVMSDRVGRIIRAKQSGMVKPIVSAFQSQPAIELYDRLEMLSQKRTGISEASKGMDPRALQSTNVKGVDMVINGAQERIELVARIIAETGLKHMFRGLLVEVCRNPNKVRALKINGKWTDINPEVFDPSFSVKVNPAIGRGSDVDRLMVLNIVSQKQEMILQTMGLDNPFVSAEQYMNTQQDMLAIQGVKNFQRYFTVPDPETIAKFAEQMRNKPQPELMLAQAEVGKANAQMENVKAKTAEVIAKTAQADEQFDRKDDLERDKLEAKTQIDAAKIGVDAMGILAGIKEDRDEAESETEAGIFPE